VSSVINRVTVLLTGAANSHAPHKAELLFLLSGAAGSHAPHRNAVHGNGGAARPHSNIGAAWGTPPLSTKAAPGSAAGECCVVRTDHEGMKAASESAGGECCGVRTDHEGMKAAPGSAAGECCVVRTDHEGSTRICWR